MPQQDPPFYLEPPHQARDGRLSWDPAGADGQLVDYTVGEHGTPIGELVRLQDPPTHGWVRGPDNSAIPETYVGYGPPLGALPTEAPEPPVDTSDDDVMMLLLLLS